MRLASLVIFSLSLAGAQAVEVPEHLKATRTLDFSQPEGMGYTQHGYKVTGPENEGVYLGPGASLTPSNGGRYLSIMSTGAPIAIAHADGMPFDAVSIDVAEYSTVAIPNVVSFRGTKADGAVVNLDFVPDRVIDGSGPKADFENLTFPAGWTGLTKLEVTTTLVALDNLTLRGLALDHFHQKEPAHLQLELLGTLNGGPYDSWGVTGADAGHVYIWNQRYTYDPVFLSAFSLAAGEIVRSIQIDADSGGNIGTGETARVQASELIWNLGGETRVLATIGSNGVTDISYPTPAGGRVLFANHWYQGHEKFAVFLAGPEGVTPVLLPDTILPNGGTPHYFPRELHYTGSSFAIATSTSGSDDRFVVSFSGGPLRLSPANGDLIPGTALRISGLPALRWLNDNSAGFLAQTDGFNTPQYDLELLADGSWTATERERPRAYVSTPLPGIGLLQRYYQILPTPPGSPALTFGSITSDDLATNNPDGLVAWMENGGRHLLIQEGTTLDGFGTVGQVFFRTYAADGVFYVTARNTEGQVGLFRGRLPAEIPTVQAVAFIPTTDGTVRFMVGNLTHGRSYVVEKAETLAGPWSAASRFTAGSPTRSVLGGFSYGTRGFFRVVEAE